MTTSGSRRACCEDAWTTPILIASGVWLPTDESPPLDCYRLPSKTSDQTITQNLLCVVRESQSHCQVISVSALVSFIPETIFEGLFVIRSISDHFLWFCEDKSISIPDSLREIFGSSGPGPGILIQIPSCIEVITDTAFENWSNFDPDWDWQSYYDCRLIVRSTMSHWRFHLNREVD
jgi:hypothetical protein